MESDPDAAARLEKQMIKQASAASASESDALRGHDVPLDGFHASAIPAETDVPPPAYGEEYGTVHGGRDGLDTKATVTNDGRVNIQIDQRNRMVSQLLAKSLRNLQFADEEQHFPPPYIPASLGGAEGVPPPPPMNVLIQIVGSRGDVQPFVALAKVLKDRYGHRVRLATHPNFKDFVTENGIEFFNIGGDPQGLMAFMVKNPGLIPGISSLRAGDVGKRRKEIGEYLHGCWRSCYETGDGSSPPGDGIDEDIVSQRPFIADCIIANPPSFAHVHIAEKLGVPLHIFFTMPYSPTQAFPHPLANIQTSNADENLTNYISYGLVDLMTWQGLGDVINRFRKRSLGLDEISLMWAPGVLQRLKIPHTYAWSPALIPKPKDWGANINISGFFFLDLAKDYTPAPDLKIFLDAGPPPIYVGFGSIVLDDPNGMTKLIFDAIRKTGQRALVSKGWGGVGGDELSKPEEVFMLGNVPHDWLFKHVSCVVHHGGAGTTSAGITAGRPTLVVPFFGDQPFWGAMVARAGAGPDPIPSKALTSDNLAEGILKCLQPETQERARELATKIATENGSELGAQSFHQFLDVDSSRCVVAPSRTAVWKIRGTQARLSAMAACTLSHEGLLNFNDLKLFRAREYETDKGPTDPLSGGASAVVGSFSDMLVGLVDLPRDTVRMFRPRPKETESGQSAHVERSDEASLSTRQSGSQEDSEANPTDESRSNTSRATPGSGKGVGKFVGATLRSPMEFSVNLNKGFHNAPRLYGDDTVRKSSKVDDFRSGLTAAGKDLGLGMYDGITGLVTQPMRGAAKGGGIGFLKGFGKGVGGFFFKPGAALFGIPAHTMKGVHKEMQKRFGSSVQAYILAARTAQGFEEYQNSSLEEREDIVKRWKAIQNDFKGKSKAAELLRVLKNESRTSAKPTGQTRTAPRENDSNVRPPQRRDDPEAAMLAMGASYNAATRTTTSTDRFLTEQPPVDEGLSARSSYDTPAGSASPQEGTELHLSKGEKDMQQLSSDELERELLNQAFAESSAAAERQRNEQDLHEEELRRAMAQSIIEQEDARCVGEPSTQRTAAPEEPPAYDREYIGETTQNERLREKTAQEKSEEQIILEYVKKQSLLEESSKKGAGRS